MTTSGKLRPVTPVSILAGEIESLSDELSGLSLPADAQLRLERIQQIAGGLDPYVQLCTTPHSDALASLVESTNAKDWGTLHGDGDTLHELESEMLSGHVEGQFLKFLIAISRASRVLEIGMFTGYATLAMAEALPDDGEIIACELDPFTAEFARSIFDTTEHGSKIHVRVGSAHRELQRLAEQNQKFDLIFVDAEKQGYLDYLRTILDGDLIADNGFVVVDNTLMQGQPYHGMPTPNGEAIRAFNDYVCSEERVQQVMVPLRDGLTLIRRVDSHQTADSNGANDE